MILALALLTTLLVNGAAPVGPETEQQLLQLALDRVVDKNPELTGRLVLVSCSSTEISPTGGVPLLRDEAWADQEDRNRSEVETHLSLPASWRETELRALDSGSVLDWERIQAAHSSVAAVVRLARPGFSPDRQHSVVQAEVLLPNNQRGWFVLWFECKEGVWSQVSHKTAWAPVGHSFPYDPRWELSQASRAN
jgi:hypothetical protein